MHKKQEAKITFIDSGCKVELFINDKHVTTLYGLMDLCLKAIKLKLEEYANN